MCLVDSDLLIHSNHYQKFSAFFIFDKLEFDMILTLKFTKLLFNLISNSNVKNHDKIPVFNGFSCFLWKILLCKFSEK